MARASSSVARTARIRPSVATSPHPGTLTAYEQSPGIDTLDPSVSYNTNDLEPIQNVYQTLITWNGSGTANFVPEVSTCVPGTGDGTFSTPSVSCQSIYGVPLIVNNGQGQPEYYTFPIDPAARFYDNATGASWPVYPSDVMFSFSRTMGFANLPGVAIQPGWIIAQSLLPNGNGGWDGGIHAPYNNTPLYVLGSMLINDSTYCPALAMTQANGCVTFNATGGGVAWPYFLQLLSDVLGGGIEPCGWFTFQNAGVPGFTGTTAANGDGPCLLPGGYTTTNSTGFQSYLNSLSPTYWDAFESLANSAPNIQPSVRYAGVGSGPYYLASVGATTGYTLQANPAYHQPSGCAQIGGGCEPAAGSYQPKVAVTYESNNLEGIQQYQAGQADFASIDPGNYSTMLAMESSGQIGEMPLPSITEYFMPYNLDFNLAGEQSIDPTGQLNVPSDFFASNTVRGLLNHAFPYTTFESSYLTSDGISTGFGYGGAIPTFMGDYAPTNISWPYLGGNPGNSTTLNSSVNSASWWWTHGTENPGNPYYDPELAQCLNVTCRFPVIGEVGNAPLLGLMPQYISQIERISSYHLQPYTFNLSFGSLVTSETGPGNTPMPFYPLGWAPDYADPTDYTNPLYVGGPYAYTDAVSQVLQNNPAYNSGTCGHTSGSFADLAYWANYLTTVGTPIPSSCQGPAYSAMLTWLGTAAPLPAGVYRTLIYNEVEHIENQLGLYLYLWTGTGIMTYASWIDPASINKNIMEGAVGAQTWYSWQYVPSAASTIVFTQSGLPAGTFWSVDVNGSTYFSENSTLSLVEATGTYDYTVGSVAGFTAAPTSGTLTVSGSTLNEPLVFTSHETHRYFAKFSETGLLSGALWEVMANNTTAETSLANSIALNLGNGTYFFAVTAPGYALSPANGTIVINGADVSRSIVLTPTPPLAPSGLAAVTATAHTIGLSWTNPSGPLTDNTVYLYTGAGCTGKAASSFSAGVVHFFPWNWSGLAPATPYSFEVTASNPGGEGPLSGCASAATSTPPPAPTALTVQSISATTIGINWTNPLGTLTDNTVYLFSNLTCSGTASSVFSAGVVTAFPWNWSGLSPATGYSFEVTASNAAGEGPPSACASATTSSPPSAPTGLVAQALSSTTIGLTWVNPGGTLTNTIYLFPDNQTCSVTPTVFSTTVVSTYPWDWSGLSPSTNYSFEVTASNAAGEGPPSACATATTAPPVPSAISDLSAAAISSTAIGLTWTNPSGTLTGNTVYFYTNATCSGNPASVFSAGLVTLFPWDWTGLTISTTYSFQVTASNVGGEGPLSNCAVATTAGAAPVAPTLTSAVALDSSTIGLTWTNPGGTLTDNTVYLFTNATCSGVASAHLSTGAPVVSFPWDWSGLSPSTTYSFQVTASNAGGESPPSNCVGASTGTAPSAPTGLAASPAGSTAIALSWTNPPGTLTDNTVYLFDGLTCTGPPTVFSAGGVISSFPWDWTGLTASTSYSFEVTASNATGGEGPASTCAGTTTLAPPPAAPSSLSASAVGAHTIALTWSNPSGTLTDNTVYLFVGLTCSGSPTVFSAGVVSTFPWDWSGLAAASGYSFQVTASNAGGESSPSGCASATTESLPAAPTSLVAATLGAQTIGLTWTNPGGTLTDNTIYLYSGGVCSSSPTVFSAGVVSSFPWDWSGLSASTTYSFQVTASNAAGEGPPSACASATTSAPPSAPTNLAASAVNSTTIGLSWQNPGGTLTDNTIYLFAGLSCTGTPTVFSAGVVSSFPWDWSGLTASTNYSFYVTASNAAGESAPSSCATATTLPPIARPAPFGPADPPSTLGMGVWTGLGHAAVSALVLFVTPCAFALVVVLLSVLASRTRRTTAKAPWGPRGAPGASESARPSRRLGPRSR